MDSNRLMHFRAIAECENITKAAEKLFISQPALSKSLSLLEAELGCSLFNRVGRRLYLNSNGRKLLNYANQINDIFDQITTVFKQRSDRTLTICGVGGYFPFILKDYFKDGMRPIKLNIVPDVSIPEMLFSGDADAAVADDYYLKDDLKIGLRRIAVLNEQLLLSVPKGHPLSSQRSIRLTDLESETIIHTTSANGLNSWLDKILELNKVSINRSLALDSETWRWYLRDANLDMPPWFESSSTFLSLKDLQQVRSRRALIKVEGVYTNRMIYIWYFENNKDFLAEFLQCAKNAYT